MGEAGKIDTFSLADIMVLILFDFKNRFSRWLIVFIINNDWEDTYVYLN